MNTNLHIKVCRNTGLLMLLAVLLAGCQTTPPRFSCSVPSGFDVAAAFEHARSDLAHEQCQFQFDSYVDRLLEIAASDPKPGNREHFSSLFSWARDQGILSQLQARDHYRRYFTPEFVSLYSDYNNCSAICPRQDEMIKQMRAELRDKERGLLKALGQRERFVQADREYNQLLTLIEATCTACAQGR